MDEREWQPIETVPEGEHVLLRWPKGGGMECAMVFRDDLSRLSYWTHSGPNSGSDWVPRDREVPTHWRRRSEVLKP